LYTGGRARDVESRDLRVERIVKDNAEALRNAAQRGEFEEEFTLGKRTKEKRDSQEWLSHKS
jgi:hypothetical protein